MRLEAVGCLPVRQKYGKVRHPVIAEGAQLRPHEDGYEIPLPNQVAHFHQKTENAQIGERLIAQQRIMIESLLESMDKHLGGESGDQKKISSLTQQLRQHIAEGYPLPSLVDSPAPTGAPFIVVLEHLANECLKIRLSANASEHCTSSTKADTASGE